MIIFDNDDENSNVMMYLTLLSTILNKPGKDVLHFTIIN